jgi:hypothetical protein
MDSQVKFEVMAHRLGLGGGSIRVEFDSEAAALKMFEALTDNGRYDQVVVRRTEVMLMEDWRRPFNVRERE